MTAVAVGSDTLSVSWGAPSGDPCPAIDYTVTYELTNLEQCQTHSGGSSSSTTSNTTITFVGLKAYSTYRIVVTSSNLIGNGSPVSLTKRTGVSSKYLKVY